MKTRKLGSILLVAAILSAGAAAATAASFVNRVCTVPSTGAGAVAQIVAATAQRVDAREQLPATQNGYEILGDYIQDAARESTLIGALRETHCGGCCCGRPAPKVDPVADARKHREAFAAILPTLKQARNAPYFVFPSQVDHTITDVPSLVCVKVLADELVKQGRVALKSGDVGTAADFFLMAVEMGTKLGAGGAIQVHQTALSMRSEGLAGLVTLLAESPIDRTTSTMIRKRLEALPEDPSELVHSMDEEFIIGLHTLESLKNRAPAREIEGLVSNSFCSCRDPWTTRALNAALISLPQYLDREQTLYENAYLKNRPYLVRMQDPEDAGPGLSCAAQRRALAEDYSTVAAYLVPDISCRMSMHKAWQTYFEGTKAMLALTMYHQDHHRYPESLQALVPTYLRTPPVDALNPSGQFVYEMRKTGFTLESVSPKYGKVSAEMRFQARVGDTQGTASR